MNDRQSIDRWLAAARADVAQRAPHAMAEHRALARWRERSALQAVAATTTGRTIAPPAPRRSRLPGARLWLAVPVAISAGIALLIGVLAMVPVGEPQAIESGATPFIALTSADEFERAGPPLLVSSQVPRVAMADYGLPVDPARADQPVDAEFLLSRTGVVLAVRFKE